MPHDFTLVLAIDGRTFQYLEQSLPTWRKNQPDLFERPWVVAFDRNQIGASELGKLHGMAKGTPTLSFVPWPPDGVEYGIYADQRERMLSAFNCIAATHVHTPHWLKLDCDALCLRPGLPVFDPDWFTPDRECETWDGIGRQKAQILGPPVIVAPKWGYTKNRDGRDWLSILDDWGNRHPDRPMTRARVGFEEYPPLGLKLSPGSQRIAHRRICSWMAYFDTAFTRKVVSACEPAWTLPVPSQDSVSWYCAARWQEPMLMVNFKRRHFTNIPKYRALVKQSREIMSQ